MITFVTRSMFFDRAKVKGAVDAATAKVLSKFGAFVRQRARSSIRQARGSSRPGEPPHGHVGLLRRLILFGYDAQRQTVVIGPMPLRQGSDAPRLLEFGGTARRGSKTLHYRARAFMGPALEAQRSKLPPMWAGSVK